MLRNSLRLPWFVPKCAQNVPTADLTGTPRRVREDRQIRRSVASWSTKVVENCPKSFGKLTFRRLEAVSQNPISGRLVPRLDR